MTDTIAMDKITTATDALKDLYLCELHGCDEERLWLFYRQLWRCINATALRPLTEAGAAGRLSLPH